MPLDLSDLDDDETVAQRISRGYDGIPDINEPRLKDGTSVSVIRGRATPSTAYHLVRKGGLCGANDGVRYANVGALREVGFVLTPTPSRRNARHISVTYPGVWDQDVALLFESCFSERFWNPGLVDE